MVDESGNLEPVYSETVHRNKKDVFVPLLTPLVLSKYMYNNVEVIN